MVTYLPRRRRQVYIRGEIEPVNVKMMRHDSPPDINIPYSRHGQGKEKRKKETETDQTLEGNPPDTEIT